jgi:hypothetical protein
MARMLVDVKRRINHVMVGFFVPWQTRAFVEPVFAESTSAKQAV